MEIIKADTIEQYNRFFGFCTKHPLVGIVHFDGSIPQPEYKMTLGFYALFLKKTTGCIINYGKTVYDFDDETMVSFAPGQTIEIHRVEDGPAPSSVGLLFHPDFLHRTSLAQKMNQYSFFSYASNEALHLSADERIVIQDYMDKIAHEIEHPIDKFSKPLIISNIEVLLNYCMRFYERQFVTREELNNDVLVRFEQLLNGYWESGMAKLHGLPTVAQLFRRLGEIRNGQDCTGVHPKQNHGGGEKRPARPQSQHKTGRRHTRIPISPTLPALLQETGRLHAKRVYEQRNSIKCPL